MYDEPVLLRSSNKLLAKDRIVEDHSVDSLGHDISSEGRGDCLETHNVTLRDLHIEMDAFLLNHRVSTVHFRTKGTTCCSGEFEVNCILDDSVLRDLAELGLVVTRGSTSDRHHDVLLRILVVHVLGVTWRRSWFIANSRVSTA